MKTGARPLTFLLLATGTAAAAQSVPPPPAPAPPPVAVNFSPTYEARCNIRDDSGAEGTIVIGTTRRGQRRFAEFISSNTAVFPSRQKVRLERPTRLTYGDGRFGSYSDELSFSEGGRVYSLTLHFDAQDRLVRAGAMHYPQTNGPLISVNVDHCVLTQALTR